jgi:hypothetical protein
MQHDESSVVSYSMTNYQWHHAVWRTICGIRMTSYVWCQSVWRDICGTMLYDELSVTCCMTSCLWYESVWRVICGISHYEELICGIMRCEGVPVVSRSVESQTVGLCSKKTYLWCQLASRVLLGIIRHEELKWYHVIWRIVWVITRHDELLYHSLPRVNLRNEIIWRTNRWYQSVRRVACHVMQCEELSVESCNNSRLYVGVTLTRTRGCNPASRRNKRFCWNCDSSWVVYKAETRRQGMQFKSFSR